MTDDKGYNWDNRWGVGGELGQKAGYYHYSNPFRSGSDCTPSRMPERPAAAQKQGKTASPFILRAEAENFTPRAFSTPREKSGNPFRIENDLWPLAKSSACVEQTADRTVKKLDKLPEDFDGKQPLKEYLMHFERCSIVNGWNEEEKAMILTASLRRENRKLLSGLTDAECRQYGKIVERLQLRFGVEKQAELHQARLLNRRQFEGESYRYSFHSRSCLSRCGCSHTGTLCCTAFH